MFAKACPSRPTLEHVTGRWGSLTMGALVDGPLRFNELRRRVDGVSEKMLSQTLRTLEADGFVAREVAPTTPPQVTYSLTDLGHGLTEHLTGLLDFITTRIPDIEAARRQ